MAPNTSNEIEILEDFYTTIMTIVKTGRKVRRSPSKGLYTLDIFAHNIEIKR